MTTDVLVCERSDTCAQAVERMREGNVGFLPVLDDGKIVGVVTDRDLAIRHVAGESRVSSHTDVGQCMTPKVISVTPETPLREAVDLMRENEVGRLLVVDSGQLERVLSLGDLLIESSQSREIHHIVASGLSGAHLHPRLG